MSPASLLTALLLSGIAAAALWGSYRFRRQRLNIVLLAIGMALLTYGHVQWWARHESPEIKEAKFIRHIVAGWALVGMGGVGFQCQCGRSKENGT